MVVQDLQVMVMRLRDASLVAISSREVVARLEKGLLMLWRMVSEIE